MARKLLDYKITPEKVIVSTLKYPDGPDGDAEIDKTVEFAVADVPTVLSHNDVEVATLASYGLSQLLQDRVSSIKGGDEKLEAMGAVFDLLKGGEFKAPRASGTGGERKATIAADFAEGFALYVQSKGKDMDAAVATAYLQGLDNEERKAIRAHGEVKAFIEQVRKSAAEKAADLDLGDLLS